MSRSTSHHIYGIHAVQSILRHDPMQVTTVYWQGHQSKRLGEIIRLANAAKIPLVKADTAMLDRLADGGVHQGVMAEVGQAKLHDLQDIPAICQAADNPLFLVLDRIQDPRNLGACLRLAAAFDVTAVIFGKHQTSSLTATARKVACGADQLVKLVQVSNVVEALRRLRDENVWVCGLDEHGDATLPQLKRDRGLALVMGAEGAGLRDGVTKYCDEMITIPTGKSFSTLNLATATGIVLYHCFLQA